jgi:hypothetical protein
VEPNRPIYSETRTSISCCPIVDSPHLIVQIRRQGTMPGKLCTALCNMVFYGCETWSPFEGGRLAGDAPQC